MVINPIVGVYIPIITIPIKGEMTIPNIGSLDPGTNDEISFSCPNTCVRADMYSGIVTLPIDMYTLGGVCQNPSS